MHKITNGDAINDVAEIYNNVKITKLEIYINSSSAIKKFLFFLSIPSSVIFVLKYGIFVSFQYFGKGVGLKRTACFFVGRMLWITMFNIASLFLFSQEFCCKTKNKNYAPK